jgi:rhodanese-related sulfurtransferase
LTKCKNQPPIITPNKDISHRKLVTLFCISTSLLNDYSTWDTKKNRFQMNPNSDFTTKIADAIAARGLKKTDPVILMCRSGDRSAAAANLLTNAGYTNVYSVYDGFEGDLSKEGRRTVNGWKNANLPWGYTLDQARAYLSM